MALINAPWSGNTTAAGTVYSSDWRDSMIQQMQNELNALRASQPKGLTDSSFNNKEDSALILELIARGYAVYKPMEG